jgi:hypothetical protein
VPAGTLDGLPDRFGHFVCLTGRDPNTTLAIADGHEGVEREPAATFHDLGDTIDRDDVFDEIVAAITAIRPAIVPTTATTFTTAAPVPLATASVLAALTTTASTPLATPTTTALATASAATLATASASTAATAAVASAGGTRATRPTLRCLLFLTLVCH